MVIRLYAYETISAMNLTIAKQDLIPNTYIQYDESWRNAEARSVTKKCA